MPKPNIQAVYTLFRDYIRNQENGALGFTVLQWERRNRELAENFKRKLEEFGLAEHINWTNNNE